MPARGAGQRGGTRVRPSRVRPSCGPRVKPGCGPPAKRGGSGPALGAACRPCCGRAKRAAGSSAAWDFYEYIFSALHSPFRVAPPPLPLATTAHFGCLPFHSRHVLQSCLQRDGHRAGVSGRALQHATLEWDHGGTRSLSIKQETFAEERSRMARNMWEAYGGRKKGGIGISMCAQRAVVTHGSISGVAT